MSYYKSTSIDTVIAKLLRDTRIVDSSYVSDFYEWIPEAMGLMKTQQELIPRVCKLKVHFHKALLPTGLIHVDAVAYRGQRLRVHNGIRFVNAGGPNLAYATTISMSDFTRLVGDTPVDGIPLRIPEGCSGEGYKLILDSIQTTFSDGEIELYYRTTALDERGLPLVVDHPDYKEAIYWFVRSKLIQSGWKDPVFGTDMRLADAYWEKHAARAISDITYPTPDEKEAELAMHVRFIPPTDYWSSFFNSTDGEPSFL